MAADKTYVCVLTGRQMAAIGSVALMGDGAKEILGRVFRCNIPKTKTCRLEAGGTVHGVIVDGQRVIDEVLVGCEREDCFVIHCHGNPLLAEQIVKRLQSHGAKLTNAEDFALSQHRAASENLIEAEAKLAMQTSATLEGVRILHAQIDGGLCQWAKQGLEDCNSLDTDTVRQQCRDILERSSSAKRIIEGVKIVIAGPPNSGKSTLLNCLAGQEQAIATDTAGTTRDWISVSCELVSQTDTGKVTLRAEFIDTAGLDAGITGADEIELAAQEISRRLLRSCDLVLYVQDITESDTLDTGFGSETNCPVVIVFNKSDLVPQHRARRSDTTGVAVSAQENESIDDLLRVIMESLGVIDDVRSAPVVITERQSKLLSAFLDTRLPSRNMFKQLLYG